MKTKGLAITRRNWALIRHVSAVVLKNWSAWWLWAYDSNLCLLNLSRDSQMVCLVCLFFVSTKEIQLSTNRATHCRPPSSLRWSGFPSTCGGVRDQGCDENTWRNVETSLGKSLVETSPMNQRQDCHSWLLALIPLMKQNNMPYATPTRCQSERTRFFHLWPHAGCCIEALILRSIALSRHVKKHDAIWQVAMNLLPRGPVAKLSCNPSRSPLPRA